MNDKPATTGRKPGANRNDPARNPPNKDPNFRQSRDLHEDRGARQAKEVRNPQTMPHPHQP